MIIDMETNVNNTNEPQHDAKLPVISRSISSQIAQLRGMIESGYGRTGKPLSVKRLKKLKDTLAQLEASQNGL